MVEEMVVQSGRTLVLVPQDRQGQTVNHRIGVPMTRALDRGLRPADATSFVGRKVELDAVRRALGASRLVTLTGTGGVGKTRLAMESARRVGRTFVDGVWFVELDGFAASVDLADVLASALQVQVDGGDAERSVVDYFASAAALLVLDNCEHLLAESARLIGLILARCPNMRILATSREALGLSAEMIYVIPPLTRGGDNTGDDAVALFLDRASKVLPEFEPSEADLEGIRRICGILEALPLAIELAAARLRVFSVSQIVERLANQLEFLTRGHRDVHARQRALRSSIEWSYALCTPEERWLWSRLAAFAGNWELEAAEYIGSLHEGGRSDAVEALQSLVEKSVIVVQRDDDDAWFSMLSAIREFGLEQMTKQEKQQARRAQRDWCIRTLHAVEADWVGPDQNRWLRLFARALPNVQAALEFSFEESGEADHALMLTVIGWRVCWQASLRTNEHRQWLERALAAASDESVLRAYGLAIHGGLAKALGDVVTAEKEFRAARELAERLDDLQCRGIVRGAWAEMLPDDAEALALRREGAAVQWDHPELTARTVSVLRLVEMLERRGDVEEAAAVRQRSLELSEATGERYESSYIFLYSGLLAGQRGDVAAATDLTRRALQLKRGVEHPIGFAHAFEILARVAVINSELRVAAMLLGAALSAWRRAGANPLVLEEFVENRAICEAEARAVLGDVEFQRAFDSGQEMPLEASISLALGETPAADRRRSAPPAVLTRREQEVARLVAEGKSDRDIATALFIAQRTAEGHVQRSLVKLGYTSRSQLAVWAAARTAGTRNPDV